MIRQVVAQVGAIIAWCLSRSRSCFLPRRSNRFAVLDRELAAQARDEGRVPLVAESRQESARQRR